MNSYETGDIDYDEFRNIYHRQKLKMDHNLAHAVFGALDKNQSDVIERNDLEQLFGCESAQEILECFDLNNDGKIS